MPNARPPRPADLAHRRLSFARLAISVLGLALNAALNAAAPPLTIGFREPAWSPDGRRLAAVVLDRLWTMQPDGSDAQPLTDSPFSEREPAWSPDGRLIAFARDTGDGFRLYTVPATGGTAVRMTAARGEERSPSWTPDGRLVFAYRDTNSPQWDLFIAEPGAPNSARSLPLTRTSDQEMQPRVSPDGSRVVFVTDRGSDDGDLDIWSMPLPRKGEAPAVRDTASPVVRVRGQDGYPSWSPDGSRLAFYGVRAGVASTWFIRVGAIPGAAAFGSSPAFVSARAGASSWSPDGATLAIGELPEPEPAYNGNPLRDGADRPPFFALGRAYQLSLIPAPGAGGARTRSVDRQVALPAEGLTPVFDQVWNTLRNLYYVHGDAERTWEAIADRYRPEAERAHTPDALEDVVDRLVAEQPLVKPPTASSRAVVVSAHPLASEAGRRVLERGGNIVDAAIAVSFALGVVEPDASGIGGDGQAVLYLRGMASPIVVEFKDQTPLAATATNRRVWRDGRIVADGPAAMNVPGLVAGLDHLFQHYASGRLSWAELIDPAVRYAQDGFVLDETLPSTIAQGRRTLEKYPAAARIFLPGGSVPRPGDRFVNRDYAAVLRTLAREGAGSFYRGPIARAIAADMDAHGGVMTAADLARYRAYERAPASGRYRDHVLFTGGPPVSAGVSMLEALQILGLSDVRRGVTAATDADYWHRMIESWKVRDQVGRGADAWRGNPDYEHHLTASHARMLFSRIDPGVASRYTDDAEDTMAGAIDRIGTGTSAFTIADADGNMISMTQTLSTWGGSFYVTPGLGFLYNNHLRASRGSDGGNGVVTPSARSNTASVPTLGFVDTDGVLTPRFAIGVAGNAWIPASAYSIIAGVVDGGMTMQEAIEAPRFLVERDPADLSGTGARVEIEDRFPRRILADLMARGHRFQKIGRKGELRYGYASGVRVDVAQHRVEGGADPRRSHAAVAVDGGISTAQ